MPLSRPPCSAVRLPVFLPYPEKQPPPCPNQPLLLDYSWGPVACLPLAADNATNVNPARIEIKLASYDLYTINAASVALENVFGAFDADIIAQGRLKDL